MPGPSSGTAPGVRRRPRLLAVRDGHAHLGWSLLAANGRPLARAAARYASVEELSKVLRELIADRQALRYAVAQTGGRDWVWSAYLPSRRPRERDADAIARSARGYLRQDQCLRSRAGFAEALMELPADAWIHHDW